MTDRQQHSILIVDDEPANIGLLYKLLQRVGFRISVAKNGASALAIVEQSLPDLILLDVMMPGINGFETCRRLKANPATQDIPVIFLSALDEVINKVEAFAVGGADYITKPFQTEEVLVRVKHQLALQVAKAEIAELNADLEQRVHQRTAQLAATNQALEQEIAERKQAEEQLQQRTAELAATNQVLSKEVAERKQAEKQLRHLAFHDAVTDFPNRTFFMEHLELALKRVRRSPEYLFAVLFIDLDRFKVVNDSLGHQVGDQLLVAIAHQLETLVRSTDIVARLGGDEFVILLDPIPDLNEAIRIAQRIAENLSAPFNLEGRQVFTTASIGIALSSPTYEQGADLLRDADIAMYRAKAKGKARYEVFNQEMYVEALSQLQLESDLRQAHEQQGFQVYYQPIVDLSTEQITGFEALLRWRHPERGWISPAEFIPLSEETGLIVSLGEWVLRSACQQLALWQTQGLTPVPLTMSVNLSARQLKDPNFLETIDDILAQTGLDGQSLQLELTESMLMANSEELIRLLSQLRAKGIRLSIDDFGTGYSSLSYLHRFPINTLKIDRSFVSRIGQEGESQEIVETILNLAHQLGMTAIAEGVESQQQMNHLKGLACVAAQGYLFSRPLPSDAAALLVTENALKNLNSCQSRSCVATIQ